MNKGRREELTKLKYVRRCKAMGYDPKKTYAFKAQGKPCSCKLCRNNKYVRTVKHKNMDGDREWYRDRTQY